MYPISNAFLTAVKSDLDDRLYKMYDKIEDTENLLITARAKKMTIEAGKLTGDNIYRVLIYFEKLYGVMDELEKRQIMESLISENLSGLSSLFLKACGPLCKLNLMKFLFVVHESPH